MLWLFAGTGAQMLCRTVVMMVLSRLLRPEDFGVVAAAMVVIGIVDTVSHLGIGPAVTQRAVLTENHIRTGFTFSVLVGTLLFVGAPLYIPLVVELFNMPTLEPILYAVCALFPLKSVGLIAESLMVRELRFHLSTRIEVLSYALGYGGLGILLAYAGLGSWALVGGTLAQSLLRTVLVIVYQPHPKKPQLDRQAFKDLFRFGGGFTLARIGNTLALQGDNFIVGRFLGPVALGLYGRAYQLMVTPASLFGHVLDRVLFPAMAKVQHDQTRLARSYRRGVFVIALLTLPATVFLYVVAPELVRLVLGVGWEGVIEPFRILAVGTLFRTSYKISDSIARATGAVYQRAWRQGVYAAMMFLCAWFGQQWGLQGVAVGVTLALTVNFVLMARLSLSLAGLQWRDFISLHVPPGLLGAVLLVTASPVAHALREAGWPYWSVPAVVGAEIVGISAILVFAHSAFFLGTEQRWLLSLVQKALPLRPIRGQK